MLGPALSHLFDTLNVRAADPEQKLTPFETALQAELALAQQLTPPLRRVLTLTRDHKVGSLIGAGKIGGPVAELETTLHEFSGIGSRLDTRIDLETHIDLGGGGWGGGDDRMQTACSKPDCPNKAK